MALDTDTNPKSGLSAGVRVQQWNSIGFRIMYANIVGLLVLGIGMLVFSEYKRSLVFSELSLLEDEARLWARALTQGQDSFSSQKVLDRAADLAQVSDRHIYIFDRQGTMLYRRDENLPSVNLQPDFMAKNKKSGDSFFTKVANVLLQVFPVKYDLPPYPDWQSENIKDYPNARSAALGMTSINAWTGGKGELIFSAGVPLAVAGQQSGTLLLVKDKTETAEAFEKARVDMVQMFLAALAITLTLSIYVAAMVARPLNRLARAAESARLVKNRAQVIPDLSDRGDEIGALSVVLREMTEALWNRMDSIERFAADVSHELKNPLTSLRSALETLPRIDDKTKRERLLGIMQEDTQRLDRLITDIAKASRLDAELSRDQITVVSLDQILQQTLRVFADPADLLKTNMKDRVTTRVRGIVLQIASEDDRLQVRGNDLRLSQVMENLIGNAISFSPDQGRIVVTIEKLGPDRVCVRVDDQGPGIPEGSLATIFDRFYSERPRGESFGAHSGLGLSIVKQIVQSSGGQVQAENRKDSSGRVLGARFTVTLPRI